MFKSETVQPFDSWLLGLSIRSFNSGVVMVLRCSGSIGNVDNALYRVVRLRVFFMLCPFEVGLFEVLRG